MVLEMFFYCVDVRSYQWMAGSNPILFWEFWNIQYSGIDQLKEGMVLKARLEAFFYRCRREALSVDGQFEPHIVCQ